MASDRINSRIERLLDQIEHEADQQNWQRVIDLAREVVGFDPGTERYFSNTAIASGGGTVRHMFFHEPTNTIWFGSDANTIGRAKLPPRRRGVS